MFDTYHPIMDIKYLRIDFIDFQYFYSLGISLNFYKSPFCIKLIIHLWIGELRLFIGSTYG